MMSYIMVEIYRLFKGKYCLYDQGGRKTWAGKKANKHRLCYVESDVLTAVTLKGTVFWIVTPCTSETVWPAEAGSKLSCFCWFLARLTIQPWKWRWRSSKHRALFNIHSARSQETAHFTNSSACCLLGLIFGPENGGGTFLRIQ